MIIRTSVPQSYLLCPLLFLINVNDMANASNLINRIHFLTIRHLQVKHKL